MRTVSPDAESLRPDSSSRRTRWVVAGAIIAMALFCAAVEASQNYFGAINFGRPIAWREAVRRTLPSWIILTLLVPPVLWFARRFPLERRRWASRIVAHLTGGTLFALAHLGGTALFYTIVDGTVVKLPAVAAKFITAYFILDVLTYCGIVGASHAWRFYREAKVRELAAARLQESLTQSRLAALRGQLNPHFLFNTLNAVTTMALKREHDNVVATLGYLSELLRVSLDDRLPQEVPLSEELELLERYLAIQRLRFGSRLTVSHDIDPDALDALVPIMILQPLAENAIVHGVAPVPGPGEVRIRANRQRGELLLEVSDSGPGFSASRGPNGQVSSGGDAQSDGIAPRSARDRTGIGLANTRARLAQLHGDAATLAVGTTPDGGARVTVQMPYREAPAVAVESPLVVAAG